jgi:hypothetical protein
MLSLNFSVLFLSGFAVILPWFHNSQNKAGDRFAIEA